MFFGITFLSIKNCADFVVVFSREFIVVERNTEIYETETRINLKRYKC
jgi:hypothetical protein